MPHDHEVSFYEQDSDLLVELARFVRDGMAAGESVVVVATAEHRAALDAALGAAATGYVALDAAEVLSRFMVAGSPDRKAFLDVVGGVLDGASPAGAPLRVYGEMVALLWERGEVVAALELEGLWNDLAGTREFTLLCAYPTQSLATGSLQSAQRVCELHSRVLPPLSYSSVPVALAPAEKQVSRVFVPVPAAVRASRSFVSAVLREWGEHAAADDGVLVTSELATNAVKHALSPFVVSLQRDDEGVRLSVEDAGSAPPAVGVAASGDQGGRGVGIVEHVARQWGWDPLPDGKVVWARLRTADESCSGVRAAP